MVGERVPELDGTEYAEEQSQTEDLTASDKCCAPEILLHDFATDLQETVKKVRFGMNNRYQKVGVLGVRWENADNVHSEAALGELLDVFKTVYNFEVQSYVIPAPPGIQPPGDDFKARRMATRGLYTAVMDFERKYDDYGSLMILVYSGYGHKGDDNIMDNDDYLISGTPFGAKINLNAITGSFVDTSLGDWLFILDACCAGHLARSYGPELLAASDYQEFPPNEYFGKKFTPSIAKQLTLLDGKPTPVCEIYALVVRYMREHNDNNKYTHTPVPLHLFNPERPSIILQKLIQPTAAKPKAEPNYTPSKKRRAKKRRIADSDEADPHVLMCVHIELDSISNLDQPTWQRWLDSILPQSLELGWIRFQAEFETPSAIVLLLSVPREVWEGLPEGRGYEFVAFVDPDEL